MRSTIRRSEWIGRNLHPGDKLGYDPRLHTPDSAARLASACDKAQAQLVALKANPIDTIWKDRPGPPLSVDHAAQGEICRRKRRGKDRACPRSSGRRRRPDCHRSAQSGLAIQHSRRRRSPYPAALSDSPTFAPRGGRSCFSTRASSRRQSGTVSTNLPNGSSLTTSSRSSAGSARTGRASFSTPPRRRPLSPRRWRRRGARRRSARTRSH